MNGFMRGSLAEYKRHKELKKNFKTHTARLTKVLVRTVPMNASTASDRDRGVAFSNEHPSLVLLTPMIEIAWADGRISRRELEIIAQAADAYGLTGDELKYGPLIERLMSRPSPLTIERMWTEIARFMETLSGDDIESVATALLAQSRFVAEQGKDGILEFLRGERVHAAEQESLGVVELRIEKAKSTCMQVQLNHKITPIGEAEALYASERVSLLTNNVEARNPEDLHQIDLLMPLVPLVKVAWAEGRVTRRERELIFMAAEMRGITAGTPAFERLSSWLELHPTDEFYLKSLERLNAEWSTLADEEKDLRRLDLLSDCINIAEASGGNRKFPAGGRRVCDDEFAAVKRISERLKRRPLLSVLRSTLVD